MKKLLLLAAAALTVVACKKDSDEPTPPNGGGNQKPVEVPAGFVKSIQEYLHPYFRVQRCSIKYLYLS